MHSPISTPDGFLKVKEGLEEMIRSVANEPSVGLYFVQQHALASMPRILSVKDTVVEKTNDVSLHTEDMEDCIEAVKSMSERGLPTADDMIKDISRSLMIMSTNQPKKGLIQNPSWGFDMGKFRSSMLSAMDHSPSPRGGSSSGSYLSNVLGIAKQRAGAVGITPSSSEKLAENDDDNAVPFHSSPPQVGALVVSTESGDELPLSSHLLDDLSFPSVASDAVPDMSSVLESYKKFKLEQEQKLQEWLQGTETEATK